MIKKILIVVCLVLAFASYSFGATRLLYEDFEDNDWSDTFDFTFNSANVSVSSNYGYDGSTYSGRMYGGSLGASFNYNVVPSEGDTFYITYKVYYPSSSWNWDGISGTGLKQLKALGGDGWPIYMLKTSTISELSTHCYFSDGGISPSPDSREFFDYITYNTWHTVVIEIRYSNTGGGFYWEYDGVRISGDQNWNYDSWPAGGPAVTTLRICGGNGFGSAGTYYVDNIEIWDEDPGTEDTTAPEISNVTIATDGDTLTIGYDGNVSASSSPTTSDDYINVDCDSTDISVTYSSGDGTSTHVYTLGSTVDGGETCNLDMTASAAFEDDADTPNALDVPVTDEPITNNSTQGDSTDPEVQGNAVVGGDGYEVTINFTEVVDTSGYVENDGFVIDIDGGTQNIVLEDIEGSGSSRTFTAATQIEQDDVVTLQYLGSAGEIEDLAGNSLGTFSGDAMTNNSTQPAPTITNTTPASFACADTVQISVTTSENATVKYDDADVAYDSMDGGAFGDGTMAGAGTQSHTETIDIAACDASYTVYARSEDGSSNQNSSSTVISFDIEAAETPSTGDYTYEWGDATDSDFIGTIQDTYLNINTDNNSDSDTLNTYTYPADTIANTIILKFDVSDIPSDATIVSATLSLYFNSYVITGGDSTYTVTAYKLINHNPVIAACNGRYYDGSTNEWTDTGEVYDLGLGDLSTIESDSTNIDLSYGYKSWYITDTVQSWVDTPSENYGVILISDNTAAVNSNRFFASSEASNSDIRPKLVITYNLNKPIFTGVGAVSGLKVQ